MYCYCSICRKTNGGGGCCINIMGMPPCSYHAFKTTTGQACVVPVPIFPTPASTLFPCPSISKSICSAPRILFQCESTVMRSIDIDIEEPIVFIRQCSGKSGCSLQGHHTGGRTLDLQTRVVRGLCISASNMRGVMGLQVTLKHCKSKALSTSKFTR